jgi:hypothetical protein
MLSVIMLGAVMLSANKLSVVAPYKFKSVKSTTFVKILSI